MDTLSKSTAVHPAQARNEPDWELGWRYETVTLPDGTTRSGRVALTPEEALHPEEGYVMPVHTSHDRIADDLCDMLRAHFANIPTTIVYHDLVFAWDHADVGNFAPDIADHLEIAGYQLTGDHYLPLGPDEDGALYLATVNLRVGVDDGRAWLEDANTGEDLMTHLEVHRALR